MNLFLASVYGGYSTDGSGLAGLVSTALRWLKVWKPHSPWYAPMPEFPTPPKGSCGTRQCMVRWLITAPPELVEFSTCSFTDLLPVNRYSASGLGREFTKSIAACTDGTATTGSTGPKISSVISGAE